VPIAIVSDVHANRHALQAVFTQIDSTGCEEVWCLGDLVGYGAEPDACVDLVRERATVCLAGNHDLAITGVIPINDFSSSAYAAAEWSRATMREDTLTFLKSLRPEAERDGIGLYHASPRDPIWEYVLSPAQAAACFDLRGPRIGLIGHSHVALSFTRDEQGTVDGQTRRQGETLELETGEWLVNPGSVGQPRDGDPRAAWLELDLERSRAVYHRTEYDIAGAMEAIRSSGLPESLADRLLVGQ
jgi:diadenosine tetraphosphatase ApaH/serine/threonine PP2A family protein phosphatase